MIPSNLRPINYRMLKQAITLRDVLRATGWRPHFRCVKGNRGRCPFHQSGNPASRSLEVYTWHVFCHRCKRKADIVDLWGTYRGLPTLQAAWDLARTFGLSLESLRLL